MATEQQLKQAARIFETLCEYLDEHNWNYTKESDSLGVNFTTKGDDFPINVVVMIDPNLMVLNFFSMVGFVVPEDMREPMVTAVTAATQTLVNGGFDYKVEEGRILYRTTAFCGDSVIGKDMIEYMLILSCYMTDKYNGKFYKMAQEKTSQADMLKMLYGEA